jgi:hypothetical protein
MVASNSNSLSYYLQTVTIKVQTLELCTKSDVMLASNSNSQSYYPQTVTIKVANHSTAHLIHCIVSINQ